MFGVAFLIFLNNRILAAETNAHKSTICQIIAGPSTYNGAHVQIRGRIEGNGLDTLLIVDNKCPDVGISIEFEKPSKLADSLMSAVIENHFLVREKLIVATLTGVFEDRPTERPRRLIRVSRVDALKIE